MKVDCFIDTNILVYAAAGRGAEESKRIRALELIEQTEFGISAQVLQEFYVTVTRKLAEPLSPAAALEWLEQLQVFPCLPVDASLIALGVETSVRFGISYWDGAIVAAAEALGASTLYSEDLSNGQQYGAITVENPFLGASAGG